jgi:DNA-binding transcriptional LysR family regulator
MKLLIRSTRSVALTAAGQAVLAGMDAVRSSILELERTAQQSDNQVQGLLRITAPQQFAQRYLLGICSLFNAQYPLVEFSIDCSYNSYDLLKDNFDLAFRATQSPPQNMLAKALFDYRHCCVAAPAYIAQHGKPNKPEDLLHHQCITAPEHSVWPFIDQPIDVKGIMQINDNFALKQLAIEGQGIIKVPEYLVDQNIDLGTLIPVLPDYLFRQNTFYIIHPQLIQPPKRVSTFVEFVRKKFKPE